MRFLLIFLFCNILKAQDGFIPVFQSGATGNYLLPGLIAFYRFDEASGDAIDASGNGRTLTEVGTVPNDSPGIVNDARKFIDTTSPDTTNHFSSASSAFNFGSSPFTITAWIITTDWDLAPGDFTIAAKGSYGGGALSWWWWVDHGSPDDTLYFSFSTDGSYTFGDASKQLTNIVAGGLGAGHYFAYVKWDGSTLSMSITEYGATSLAAPQTKAFAGPLFFASENMTFGVNPGLFYDTTVTMDEAGFWSRALDSCELAQLYTAKEGSFTYPSFDSLPCDNYGSFIQIDSGTGQIQIDSGTGQIILTP